jgi:hypothetical protein
MAEKLNVYAPGAGTETLHQDIDGIDYVMDNVPEEAVERWEQSGWKKAPAKVAKAAENKEA